MARFGIISGLLLCVDTAMALFGSVTKAPLLFLPMMLGIPIMFFGVVALNPHRRRQALTTAALIGALGCVIGCGHLLHFFSLWRRSGAVNLHYTQIVVLMVAVCVAFLLSYVWSMWRGRRRRIAPAAGRD
jgi:preprotein translocase subunit SecY